MSKNLSSPILSIDKGERKSILGQTSKILWYTGLSGSGKSTLANTLKVALYQQGENVFT